jgi:transketolase
VTPLTSVELAWKIRRNAIELAHKAKASHVGAMLSIADITAVLYADVMNYRANEPEWDGRDRFILSKGHAGLAVYAALSLAGFFPQKKLDTYYMNGSFLSGHISHKNVPGVELSTGALGHGVCVAAGMALAAKKDGKKHRVFSIIGDGECNEGSIWEMALFSNHFRLNNLCVIVDRNKMQSLGFCEDTIELLNLGDKWRSFGWRVLEIDGHDHAQLKPALEDKGRVKDEEKDKPLCVIAHTVKGKGISFMENQILWHYRDPQGEDYEKAVKELEAARP